MQSKAKGVSGFIIVIKRTECTTLKYLCKAHKTLQCKDLFNPLCVLGAARAGKEAVTSSSLAWIYLPGLGGPEPGLLLSF